MQGLLSTSNILLTKTGKFVLTNLGKIFSPITKVEPKHIFPFPPKKPIIVKPSDGFLP